jgi:hypothetical protein
VRFYNEMFDDHVTTSFNVMPTWFNMD